MTDDSPTSASAKHGHPDETHTLGDALLELAEDLGISAAQLTAIFATTTDWAFVIQVNALLEAVLSRALEQHLDARLAKLVRDLPMRGRFSKSALAATLGGLNQRDAAVTDVLTLIRNDYAHDARFIETPLRLYFATLSPEERRSRLGRLGLNETLVNEPTAPESFLRKLIAGSAAVAMALIYSWGKRGAVAAKRRRLADAYLDGETTIEEWEEAERRLEAGDDVPE